MIYDITDNAQRYMGMSRNMDRALRYMMETDLTELEDGRHEIDGDKVFVNIMHADTKADRPEYEFHEEYYDIQIDLSEEKIFSLHRSFRRSRSRTTRTEILVWESVVVRRSVIWSRASLPSVCRRNLTCRVWQQMVLKSGFVKP